MKRGASSTGGAGGYVSSAPEEAGGGVCVCVAAVGGAGAEQREAPSSPGAFWKRDQLHPESWSAGFPLSHHQTFVPEVAQLDACPAPTLQASRASPAPARFSPPPPISPSLNIMQRHQCRSQSSHASHGYFSSPHSILFSQELIIVLRLTVCLASRALIANSTRVVSWCVNVLSRHSNTPDILVISS